MTSRDNATKNPIATAGLFLSPEEFDVLSKLLVASAKHIERKEPQLYRVMQRILGRMSQAVQNGNGLLPEHMKIHQERIHAAFAQNDETILTLAVEDLIASTLRTDSDPGLRVARYLMQFTTEILAAQAQHSVAALEHLGTEIEDATKQWSTEGWPAASDVASWIAGVVSAWTDSLASGEAPWDVDGE